MLRQQVHEALGSYDVLLTPTSGTVAYKLQDYPMVTSKETIYSLPFVRTNCAYQHLLCVPTPLTCQAHRLYLCLADLEGKNCPLGSTSVDAGAAGHWGVYNQPCRSLVMGWMDFDRFTRYWVGAMAKKKGTALLVVFTDVDSEQDSDFNAWYNQEHLPERLSAPGFLDGARYEAVKGGPRYLAVYELESPEALQSSEYLRQSQNPTEWTKRVSPTAIGRGSVRNVYTQIFPIESDPHTVGRGMAPALQIGRMDVPADIDAKYNEYYDTIRTPANLEIPGCLFVRRYHAVEGGPNI